MGTIVCLVYVLLIGFADTVAFGMLSIILHECGHTFAALALGCTPCEFEITPMGAMMRLDDNVTIPVAKRLLILLAGPAVTFGLCWLAILMTKCSIISMRTGAVLFGGNAVLLFFNLLPALPLDGGNLVLLLLKCLMPEHLAGGIVRTISSVCGLGCIAVGLLIAWCYGGWNLTLCCSGCFMLYAGVTATRNNALHELRSFMERKIRLEKKRVMLGCITVLVPWATLREAVVHLHPRRYTFFYMLNENLGTSYVLTETEIIEAYMHTPGECVAHAAGKEQPCSDNTPLRW